MISDEQIPTYKRDSMHGVAGRASLVKTGERSPMYEMSLNVCVSWQAQSLSNAGSYGSNRMLGRDQLLSNGTRTQAYSGNIAKHYNAVILAEKMEEAGIPLCAACARRDGRRAAALVGREGYENLTIEGMVRGCGLCDVQGALVTTKNADSSDGTGARQGFSKHSLLEFSFALALPDRQAETMHIRTRVGDTKEAGQMLMKMPARSGTYAFNVRYKAVGIGVDTNKWRVIIADLDQRLQRHQVILSSLQDQILSPSGALTSTMLPHLTGLKGAIVVRERAGRAAIYSALEDDFVERLIAVAGAMDRVIPFNSVDEFSRAMDVLIDTTYPCLPHTSHLNDRLED